MGNILSTYSINFKGLNVGRHSFEFDLNNAFFCEFEEGEISRGQLKVAVNLNKLSHLLEFKISIKGNVQVVCDRCLELFDLPITYKGVLFAKIGLAEENGTDGDIIFLSEEDHEVNLAQYLYESVCLSLPLQRYHGINGTNPDICDKEMLAKMGVATENTVADDEIDPRWEKLKNFRNN
ncbi:MAG: DUF177 domain-containing protein [Bacteroidales bacterium]